MQVGDHMLVVEDVTVGEVEELVVILYAMTMYGYRITGLRTIELINT